MSEAGFLADTHVVLWALAADPRRNKNHDILLTDPRMPIFVSAISRLEIAIKTSIGKMSLGFDLHERCLQLGFLELPFTWHHAKAVEKLPFIHRDPFDRTLIAQAQTEGLTLMTTDPQIRKYDVDVC